MGNRVRQPLWHAARTGGGRAHAGRDVLFDIDWQGTQQLREASAADVVSVFILPPGLEELERRLHTRAANSAEVIAGRMARARDEIGHWAEYDYVLVNEDVDTCLAHIRAILQAERLVRERQVGLHGFVRQDAGRMMRARLPLPLLLALSAPIAACATGPRPPPWQQVILAPDRQRLAALWDAWTRALATADKAGETAALAALAPLADPKAAVRGRLARPWRLPVPQPAHRPARRPYGRLGPARPADAAVGTGALHHQQAR